jgi:hypothetical protein
VSSFCLSAAVVLADTTLQVAVVLVDSLQAQASSARPPTQSRLVLVAQQQGPAM